MSRQDGKAANDQMGVNFSMESGFAVLDLLAALPDEIILDLGCGDGALTEQIVGRVLGLDHSESMTAAARARGVKAIQADMHDFVLKQRFHAVFTNATLHWSTDIDAVVECVSKHLRPGGRFVGEFGGCGNVAAITRAIHEVLRIHGQPDDYFAWYFPTTEEFTEVLERHGFRVKYAALIPHLTPMRLGMREWMETFARPWMKHLPKQKQLEIFGEVESLLDPAYKYHGEIWVADYSRLRFQATFLTPAAQPELTSDAM